MDKFKLHKRKLEVPKIIWLSSYPKSGNTWLRTIIGQFFEKDFNKDKVFENSKKIRVYPSKIDYLEPISQSIFNAPLIFG